MYEILSKSTQELLKQFQKGQPSWWLFLWEKRQGITRNVYRLAMTDCSRWRNSKLHHRVTVNVKLGCGDISVWTEVVERQAAICRTARRQKQTNTHQKKIIRMSSTLLFSARSQYGKRSWSWRYCIMLYRKKNSPSKIVVYKKETPWLKVHLQYDVVWILPTCSETNSSRNEKPLTII